MITRRWLPAAGFGAVLLLGASLAAVSIGWAADKERRAGAERAADFELQRIAATIDQAVLEMERLAAGTSEPAEFRQSASPRMADAPELHVVALAQRDGGRLVVQTAVPSDLGPLRRGHDLSADAELAGVLTRVLTEADAAAGSPFDLDGETYVLVAAPVLGEAGASETDRRSSVVGAVVGALATDVLLAGWTDGISISTPDSDASIGDATTGNLFDGVVDITGRPWRIELDRAGSGWPRSAWIVLGLGIVLAVLGAELLHVQLGRRRRAEDQASERSRQLARIAETGARLQQSLDLSELLPAFAVSLASDFDLQAVSISLLDDAGTMTETFATGDASIGGSIDLPLRRGFRSVGALTVRPGRELDDAERTSLQALADLLAVAMSNAQLYEREQANAARLRDLDALKNAFLGTVSHELRTSMTAIIGFGELLTDAWDSFDDERRREMAGRIRRSAGSLRHLVDDLLDFARLEQERLRVSPRHIDLGSVVSQTIDSLTPLLGKHEIALRIEDGVDAWADPVAVERILGNLVSNAAKYSPAGTTVTVAVERHEAVARLTVSDEGPGIPPDERRRIFVRFYRLDTPEAVRTRGAGIGLAILRDFAERSGAPVTVDDAPGGGARFTIDFPTQPADSTVDDEWVEVAP